MNILCPTDFSPTSFTALEYAVKIGEKHKAHLHLLYAFTEEEFNKKLTDDSVLTYEQYKAEAEAKLESIANEIRGRKKGGRVDFSVVSGDLITAVQNAEIEYNIDFIVIGTKGASDVMEKMAGTNAIKIIENTKVPVLAVPKNADYERIAHVVYASDYANDDIKVIKTMITTFQPFDPIFTILHLTSSYDTHNVKALDDFRIKAEREIQFPMSFYLKTHHGSIALGIDEYMMENESNMLCILMEKHDLIERIFHKSVTLQLTYMMDFPLFVLK